MSSEHLSSEYESSEHLSSEYESSAFSWESESPVEERVPSLA